jgi:hypothetical protein
MMTPEQTAKAAAEHLAAQQKNYGTYVAAGPIYINGALAYATGHAVSAEQVDNGIVAKEQVHKVGSKAAEAIPTPGPVVDPNATPVV